MQTLRTHGGRRWALQGLGALLLSALAPSLASAKRRRKKKKAAAPEPEPAADGAQPAGDALSEAQLQKRDGAWFLKNRHASGRIVIVLRYKPLEGRPSLHAFSLEAGQEIALGINQPEGMKKPIVELIAAQFS